jgi:hypothetical protein
MASTKITSLPTLTTPSANGSNTMFVVVDKSSGVATTKQLSLENLDISIDNVAAPAFAQANSANVLAQAAFNQANTTNIKVDSAYDFANTINVKVDSAYAFANIANIKVDSAYAFANIANIKVDSAYAFANTINVKVDSAYAFANIANSTAEASFTKANAANVLAQAAFSKANTSNVIAQAAFDQANTNASSIATLESVSYINLVESPPSTPLGEDGDFAGLVHLSNTALYYSTGDYDGSTNIWSKIVATDSW